jgi:hypothetical protein
MKSMQEEIRIQGGKMEAETKAMLDKLRRPSGKETDHPETKGNRKQD